MVLGSKRSSLGSGGHIGAVDGDDGVEEVAGFGGVVCFGDDTDGVLPLTAGHRHVQAATGRCSRGELEAGRDGVRLGTHFGGGVAESNVLGDIVSREGDLTVTGWAA